MRVLVTGATGALGRPLVALLSASGHTVIAASRAPSRSATTAQVMPVALDVLDPRAVSSLIGRHRPDAIVHFATAIPHDIDPKRIGRQFETTNRLRREGTANLLAAARDVGTGRFIAQGLAYAYEPADAIRDETAPIWPDPPAAYAPVAAALRDMEAQVAEAGGTVLRLGHIYGPGTTYAPDGSMTRQVRERAVPIVGKGSAHYSFVHVDDAASAVLAALDRPVAGAFNIVDDTPLRTREWLPWFAEHLGAKPPRRVPPAIARLAVGPFGVAFMDRLAGASNARARAELRWRPRFASFTQGVPADGGARTGVGA